MLFTLSQHSTIANTSTYLTYLKKKKKKKKKKKPHLKYKYFWFCFFPMTICMKFKNLKKIYVDLSQILSHVQNYIFSHYFLDYCCCYSVAKSCTTLQLHGLQHVRLPSTPLSPGVCSDSCLLSLWWYLTVLSSATPFFFSFNISQHQGLF